jgi:Trk-type K+ transport system membrane component
MRPTPAAVLLQLDAVWIVLLVLVRVVIATLALLASERDKLTHVYILSDSST